MSEIKWGIIGLGNIAFEFASAFKEIKNSKLLGIASKDTGRLNKFKEQIFIKSKILYFLIILFIFDTIFQYTFGYNLFGFQKFGLDSIYAN